MNILKRAIRLLWSKVEKLLCQFNGIEPENFDLSLAATISGA